MLTRAARIFSPYLILQSIVLCSNAFTAKLLGNVRVNVVRCVVDMHKGAVDDGHRLEEIRQNFTEIVAILQRHVGIENNVDLDEELVARVVSPQILDLSDGRGEAHGKVEDY